MREFARAGFFALGGSLLLTGHAIAQPAANVGCTASPSAAGTQTWRCDNGITIVAENGARFELKDANRDGHIDSVELSSKALLIEVPKKLNKKQEQLLRDYAAIEDAAIMPQRKGFLDKLKEMFKT